MKKQIISSSFIAVLVAACAHQTTTQETLGPIGVKSDHAPQAVAVQNASGEAVNVVMLGGTGAQAVAEEKPAHETKPEPTLVAPAPKSHADQVQEEVASKLPDGVRIDFKTGSSDVDNASAERLDAIVKYLKENKSARVIVEGHVDASGKKASNIKLANQRAQRVKNLLVRRGASGKQISAKGMGNNPDGRYAVVKLE